MNKFLKFCFFTFLLLSDFIVFAQPNDDGDEGPVEGVDPAPAPINGKLILLLILGVTFAFYKLKNATKEA
ncbi:hypothetical protein [Flavobacterium sp.]|uniref:hypothetical protein n=1 Tax=Flavobacterium sp. TaxID=239 RepID=UPI00261C3767|nr:hypothetical protein [Flavobacterium sp.]